MTMQLFVDMDGVLADFDRHHETVFGARADTLTDTSIGLRCAR
jgi:beta-phosphoglucomutase-like phosphatase (HAD superfamily)